MLKEEVLLALQTLCDLWFALIPRRPVNASKNQIKMVAHRGLFNNTSIENTLDAFHLCAEHGVWGIEFDVRWTKDLVPVVHHDAHCGRLFKRPDLLISKTNSQELRSEIPQIPLLTEVLENFAGQFHFMIELKENLDVQKENILNDLLKNLKPMEDYHLLSLSIDTLSSLSNFPQKSLVLVSEFHKKKHWQACLQKNWGGYATHYLLLSQTQILEAHAQNINVGVGYIASQNSLLREAHRHADWLFTNQAEHLLNAKP